MFNIGPMEFLVIAVLALVVLGPDRLPDAARQAGKMMGDLRKLSTGFQNEMKNAFDDADRASAASPVVDAPVSDPVSGPEPLSPVAPSAAIASVSTQARGAKKGPKPSTAAKAVSKKAPPTKATTKKAPAKKAANGNPTRAAAPKKATTPTKKASATKTTPTSAASKKATAAKAAPAPKGAGSRSAR